MRAVRHSDHLLMAHCATCNSTIFGGTHGSRDSEALIKAIKAHEEEAHPPYDPDLRRKLKALVLLHNGGGLDLPFEIGRYSIRQFRN